MLLSCRLHTESIGSDDDLNNNVPNGDVNSSEAKANRPAISHLRKQKEEAAVEGTVTLLDLTVTNS